MDRKPGTLRKDLSNVTSALTWVKLVGVGDVGTGKTCLIKSFCESQFSSNYLSTVGVDYGFKLVPIQDYDLRVHLWDFSGSPEYFEVRNELYTQTDGVFIVFDLTNPNSFSGLDYWIREVQRFASGGLLAGTGVNSPDIVLVGNKSDVREKRAIQSQDARKFAQKHKITYFETSAATGDGVIKMFDELLTKIVHRKKLSWETKVIPRPS